MKSIEDEVSEELGKKKVSYIPIFEKVDEINSEIIKTTQQIQKQRILKILEDRKKELDTFILSIGLVKKIHGILEKLDKKKKTIKESELANIINPILEKWLKEEINNLIEQISELK